MDDLDCHDPDSRRDLFEETIQSVPEANSFHHLIGFASPEIEAWLIADWGHTFSTDYQLLNCHQLLRYRLGQNGVVFHFPERFSQYDNDREACSNKLSELIVNIDHIAKKKCCLFIGLNFVTSILTTRPIVDTILSSFQLEEYAPPQQIPVHTTRFTVRYLEVKINLLKK